VKEIVYSERNKGKKKEESRLKKIKKTKIKKKHKIR
jgi:hypothetical protein